MEDKLTLDNVTAIAERQETHALSRKGGEGEEERLTKMDSFEFFSMASGGLIVGAAIYLVSLFVV
ncbi:MAG TPA: hypothetical protein VFK33_12820 [Bacillales bacterium]|nr:hypothetical protein [Bacillales bacterium]